MVGSAGSKYGIVVDEIPIKSVPNLKPLIDWVCNDCGTGVNPRATWHEGQCDICKQTKPVTERRDFSAIKFRL